MGAKTILTFCQHCQMKCRLFCRVADGKITHIANAMGVEGVKAINTQELIYHPDRLLYPLKRIGERGEGKWQRISWDEALDTMASRFGEIKDKYGPQAIATVRGCGHKQMARLATILFSHVIGTPNVLDVNEACNVPSHIAGKLTMGDSTILDDGAAHFQHSKCILLWGSNMRHNRSPQELLINRSQADGAKLIVVDPRPPERLDIEGLGVVPADIWLRLRPGTDAALALGMVNVIINEGIYNKDFVDNWCVGFDELKERVQEYPPDKVADITWVPEEQIIEAARLFATTKPSCLHIRLGGGGGLNTNCTQSSRAVTILTAVAGDIDVRGGNVLYGGLGGFRPIRSISYIPELPFLPGVEEKRLGAKEFPVQSAPGDSRRCAHNASCIQAMLDGDIKAFFVPGANVVVSLGDSQRTWKALKNLEFSVVVDFFMTPTAELADLVLPAAHFFETEVPMNAYQTMGPRHTNYILAPKKLVEPAGECWDDRTIVLELAKRMGVKTPWNTVEEMNDWQLEKVGVKYKDIREKRSRMMPFPLMYKKYEQAGFDTPSGKIELYSSVLKDLGYGPLPYYEEPPESPYSTPELAKDYPLIMIDHRNIVYTHSEFRQLSSLRKEQPDQQIQINPDTAKELGIAEGDEVYIERPGFERRVRGKAKFVPGLHPKVISCVALWWFPEKPGPEHGCFDSNTNTIIASAPPYDPIVGNYTRRGLLCRVGKA